jgi:hypothetical protein
LSATPGNASLASSRASWCRCWANSRCGTGTA